MKNVVLFFTIILAALLQQGRTATDNGSSSGTGQENRSTLFSSSSGNRFYVEVDSISCGNDFIFLRAVASQFDPKDLYSDKFEHQITRFWDVDYSWGNNPEARPRFVKDDAGVFFIAGRTESNPLMMFKFGEKKSPEKRSRAIQEETTLKKPRNDDGEQQMSSESQKRGDLSQENEENKNAVLDIVNMTHKAIQAADTARDKASDASDAEAGSLWNEALSKRIEAVTVGKNALQALKEGLAALPEGLKMPWIDGIKRVEEEIKNNEEEQLTILNLANQYES